MRAFDVGGKFLARGRAPALGLFALFALFALGAAVAAGCGWDGLERSVRFNLYANDRDRQRLPPLPFKLRGAARAEESHSGDYRESDEARVEIDSLWGGACEAVARGELERARSLLKEYAARGGDAERLNSAADQLDALAALDHGSPREHVRAYLEARGAYDRWFHEGSASHQPSADVGQNQTPAAGEMPKWNEEVESRLASIGRDRELADNVAYMRAAGVYRAGQPGDAAEAFAAVAARHPRGEKREAALFMAGKATMERSGAYLPGETATSEDACPEWRDDDWRAARGYFLRVAAEYPHGRLAGDARGWLAYLDMRVGDHADALVWYYRMLSDETDTEANDEALRSLRLARGRADEADMERVEAVLASEPRAALAYAYHEIYNYTDSYYFRTPEVTIEPGYDCSKHPDACEKWRNDLQGKAQGHAKLAGLARIARFASRMKGLGAGAAFNVRVAQADLELGEDTAALTLARRALVGGAAGVERASALWVEGVAEYRLKNFDASRRALARIVAEFPGGDVSDRARRMLALASEEAGDLEAALEQYLALDYDSDVAYFVDVLLTPDQLASFVARHQSLRERDMLLYSLGVRYLRAGRYAEARAALRGVRTLVEVSSRWDEKEYDYYAGYYDEDNPPHDAKYHLRLGWWDDEDRESSGGAQGGRETGVYADWILTDLKTADDLERLEGEAARAVGEEAQAEALYQLAAYLYEGSDLKFYNPALWRGSRSDIFSSFGEENYRSPGEADTVWRYMQEHETAARALSVFLEVSRRFPRTRAARDALYSAAVCQQHLSNFNGYWRSVYAAGLHAGARDVTYKDVLRTYPGYRLPAGENGWEPATRTVNGRAAWPAPPKPRPLTRTERMRLRIKRVELRLAQGWELFGEVYGGRVRAWTVAALRWTVVAVFAGFVLSVFRRTRRARRFIYRRLARGRAPRKWGATYAPRSSYGAHSAYLWSEGPRSAAGRAAAALFRLALHERGRAALALNLFTHGLLTLLFWVMLWAMRKG